ncbi:hypothetical protein THICB1_160029 [Thiomonas arsenitoxydans]|uniref:Uncharacterized protein n=1 Tax=Thiomonas arsenitoxydans (strain DSM 22701 / CIP 110005 / 3As) TaxID=426114 RepID=A0ABP1Z1E3_THIA3|nr:hypothetical protein THICB1_160029 [Thiomonas arsenitoxydans]
MVMLRFLLDTNICIYLMKEQPEPVIRRFSACKPGEKIWLLVGRPANQDAMSLSTRCGPGSAKQHQRC